MELHLFTFGAFYRLHKKPFGFTNVEYELAAMKTKHNSPIRLLELSGIFAILWTQTSRKPGFRFLKFPVH